MPRSTTFKKEDILNVAYELVRKEGMEAINARRIAKELNSSVHPIFNQFKDMNSLKEEIYTKILDKYHEYMLSTKEGVNPYKQMGLSYIKFAKDYPEFFKLILMQKTNLNVETFLMTDKAFVDDVIKTGQQLTGLSYEEQKRFHIKVWIITHGIACLVATSTVQFTDEDISKLLGETVLQLLKGYKMEGNKGE